MIVKQVKYYNEDDKKFLNNPIDITADKLSAEKDEYKNNYFYGIICDEIQIRAYPGTVVTINGEDVIIGEIGVYNILYREKVQITSLVVNKESIDFIKKTPLAYFIITFILHEDEISTSTSENSSSTSGQEGIIDDDDSSEESAKKEEEIKDNHDSW